jgi:hypothetical protein
MPSHRFIKHILCLVVLVVLSLLCASTAPAQDTAAVVGTVADTSGAVIPGATVTITNVGTSVSQTAQTSDSGDYVFTLLQVGTYAIKVEQKGFKSYVAPSITLAGGDRTRVDAKMVVGEVTETVEISGSVAPALQTETSTIGSLVPSQSVEDLPLDGRNIVKLVQLTVGTTEGAPGSIAAGNRPDDRRQTSAFSANGQTDAQNENMIDGFDNNERAVGFLGARPSVDAIQEVNVSTNKYDASIGRTGGAVVDVVTKAGTNDFHGSAFEFFRNKVLNTNPNWEFSGTAAPNPAFRQNQWGGSIGGPVIKNKTFFFGDYEQLDYAIGQPASLYSVPTYCERGAGNSSSPFAKPCPDGGTKLGDFTDINLVSASGGSNSQPNTPGPNVSNLPLCTAGATPGACLSPIGTAFLNMYPLPNTGAAGAITNNYTSAPVKTQNNKTYDARVDEHLSDANSIWAHITYNGETTITPNGFPNVFINPATGALASAGGSGGVEVEPVVSSYAGPNHEDQYLFGTSFVHVYNPNLLLNLKFAVFRSQILSFPANQGTGISTALGFPCTATSCVNYTSGASLVGSSGLTHFSISGLNGAGGYTTIGDTTFIPLGYWDTSFQYYANLTWNKGAHSMRYGVGLIRRRDSVAQSNAAQGQFNFNGSYTGVAGADTLEGLSSGLSRNNALVQQGFRSWEPSGYIQDDWRARPSLTINIGVRYDIFTPYTEVHGRIANWDPFIGMLVSPALPGAQQSNATAMVSTPYTDFAPRIGFAKTLPRNTVLRGGFGLSFFPTNYQSSYFLLNAPFNYPVSCNLQNETATNSSCSTAQFDGPAGQFTNGVNATYGTCPFNNSAVAGTCQTPTVGSAGQKATLTSSTVYCPSCQTYTGGSATNPGGTGGSYMPLGLPVPQLNINLATNTANYAGTTIIGLPTHYQEAYLEQMNLQLQKQFGANVINIGYVGELGRHAEVRNLPENQATNPSLLSTPPLTLGGVTPIGVLPGFAWMKSGNLTESNNWGTSAYEALQTSFVRRFGSGLTVNFNYVWSHMMSNVNNFSCVSSYFATPTPCYVDTSNGTGSSAPRGVYNFNQYAWGNDTQDVADRLTWGVNYSLPFGKSKTGAEGALLKGWGVNASGSWQTGLPFSVTANSNNSGLSQTQYLDQTGSGKLSNPTRLHWFDYTDFVQPVANTLGDEHTLQLFGPHQKRFDVSLFKEIPVHENVRLQFRTEVFNLFNQVNMGQPGASIAFNSNGSVNLTGSHSTTGQITSMSGNWNQREIQFALKLLF